MDLSIIIVNYNTREHLKNCLESIYNTRQEVSYEVWVVDNNSTDSSSTMVEIGYPQVRLVKNSENLGFARANNQAIRQAEGSFLLLLNPDTIVFDHVFDRTIDFLQETPETGMVTCKLVKPDGTLDLACRRSFPSAFDGFCRASGLSKMFPKSHLFAQYNLTFLDENEISEVDAINGAFMMVKREALSDVGLLDEDYFMYMEDLDWCFRFKQKGWKVYYVPNTKVIHLKGESGKENSNGMISEFYKSMEMFYKKTYRPNKSQVGFWFTILGIKGWKYCTLCRNSIRAEKRVTP